MTHSINLNALHWRRNHKGNGHNTEVTISFCCKYDNMSMIQGCPATIQSTLRPTKWVTLECTKNISTRPHKPIRNSLLAKITLGYLKWLRACGRNYYAHQHPNSYVFPIIQRENLLHTQHSRCISLQGNNQQ